MAQNKVKQIIYKTESEGAMCTVKKVLYYKEEKYYAPTLKSFFGNHPCLMSVVECGGVVSFMLLPLNSEVISPDTHCVGTPINCH
jgi:hypothetical protein